MNLKTNQKRKKLLFPRLIRAIKVTKNQIRIQRTLLYWKKMKRMNKTTARLLINKKEARSRLIIIKYL
jgi:hypothetical protein